MIDREQIPAPTPTEIIVPLGSLGGDVLVRGIALSELLAIHAQHADAPGHLLYCHLAARMVLADDGEPIWPNAASWDIHFGGHPADFADMRKAIDAVTGTVREAKKNSESSPA